MIKSTSITNYIILLLLSNSLCNLSKDIASQDSDLYMKSSSTFSNLNVEQTLTSSEAKVLLKAGSYTTSITNKDDIIEFKLNNVPMLKLNSVSGESPQKVNINKELNIQKELVVKNKKQWLLAYRSNYEDIQDSKVISDCGPYRMLGGYNITSTKELKQSFELPEHEYIKITGNYHFIDFWQGEAGYLKVGYEKDAKTTVWSQTVDSNGMAEGPEGDSLNVCGAVTPESYLGQRVQVILKHKQPKLNIFFGSTLSCTPDQASYGISDVEVYVL